MALAVLNRYGPLLTHYLETPQLLPWHLYGSLRQLVGELSLFSDRCDMLGQTPDGRALVPAYKQRRGWGRHHCVGVTDCAAAQRNHHWL